MSVLAEFPFHLLAMALLLAASSFFSGAETALFNLSRDQLRRFRASRSPLRRAAARLMDEPRRVLVTVLFSNMTVNVAFFVMGVTLMRDVAASRPEHAAQWRLAIGVLTPVLVIFFGEVTPKSVAATMPERIAPLAALPLMVLERVVLPVRVVLGYAVVGPLVRLITGGRHEERGFVTNEELQAIVEVAEGEGTVSGAESDMLADILELGEMKVREVMTPRVEIVGCDARTPMAVVLAIFRRTMQTKILVYEGRMDRVAGIVYAKTAFLEPDAALADLVRPVYFVPESKTVESLLKDFRARRVQFAVVVDEYGGLAGLVTLEDCLEEIVGEIEDETDRPAADPVRRLGPSEYLLDGNLSIRSWEDLFDMDLPEGGARYTTVAGFVTALLGRLPERGDTARWRNLEFTVEEVGHRRITRVRLRLLPPEGGAGPADAGDADDEGPDIESFFDGGEDF
ncbi:MAG: HlyC/CorC family transporter [Acidobacteria bacterium]|nr:HlyC/CorC family transporter [Acidobacteriota bacterium]